MAARESIWGPELGQYSQSKFDPQISDISNREIEDFIGKYGIPPLTSIENSLCTADPRSRYPPGFSGITHLHMMTDTLQKYLLVGKDKIFRHYYGFLLVRFLVHVVCDIFLSQTNSLGKLVGSLPQNTNWAGLSQAMAFGALDRAGDMATTADSLVDYCNALINLISDESLGEVDALGLVRLLWEDRGSFMALSSHGLLPGSTLVLLAALKQLATHSDQDRYRTDVYYLQDLGFRLYLVGSRRDRQVLVPVYLFAMVKNAATPRGINVFIDPEDSHAIARAYSGLLLVWKQYGASPKSIPTSLVGHLANFVTNMTVFNPSATTQDYIDITSTSFRYLWLQFEHKGGIPVEQHVHARGYSMTQLTALRVFQQRKISTKEDKHNFAQMLADIEIVNLIGRVLLLITEEGGDIIQNAEPLAMTLIPLSEFKNVLDFSVPIAPGLFSNSKIEWAKILAHMKFLIVMGMVKRKGKSGNATNYPSSVFSTWAEYASSMQDRHSVLRECAYPRCCQPSMRNTTLRARHICGGCSVVAYCGSYCQKAHWQFPTSDSHRLACNPSREDKGDEDEEGEKDQ
ncbi:hypothetical protein FS749_009556 [Ceratobasidium sp. UAMH 11750]|nr:hypothetical protein FS749_009556 [Ceratobasidium sp. UAMH 11750]